MDPELITRILALVAEHGDRAVVVDPKTNKAVVLLELSSYETLCLGKPGHTQKGPATSTPADDHPGVPPGERPNFESIMVPTEEKKPPTASKKQANLRSKVGDLTQDELLDKIDREIGEWKNAKVQRRTDELQAVAKTNQGSATTTALAEEERFYLEPIE